MDIMQNKITKDTIEKYYNVTKNALNIAKKSISKNQKKKANEIIKIVECYLEDSIYFKNKKDYVNSFGAIYYAHGWMDCGARLKIFNVKDSDLFTI